MTGQPRSPYVTFGFWVNLFLTLVGYVIVIVKVVPVLVRLWIRGDRSNPYHTLQKAKARPSARSQ